MGDDREALLRAVLDTHDDSAPRGPHARESIEAVEAAAADAEAQAQLAAALKNTTGATDAQIAASEEYISALSSQTALADDELRPALANLTRGFGDVEQAEAALALATDIVALQNEPHLLVLDARRPQRAGERVRVPWSPSTVAARGRHVWVAGLSEDRLTHLKR